MSEYRVVYVVVEAQASRAQVAETMQQECTRSGREGWHFVQAVADLEKGTTRGIFLWFSSDDGEGHDVAATIALAETLMAEKPRD